MLERNERVDVWSLVALWLAMVLTTGVAFAEETAVRDLAAMEEPAIQNLAQGMKERIRASLEGNTSSEQPDHVLYRQSEQRWNRLLRDALNLPSWIELSAQQRTRFESISHTWRAGQLGQTDVQIPQRTNARLGATQGPFSPLFEGMDSRTNGQNLPNDFNGAPLVNRTDILQLFASATFRDTFGTGLRTDVHVGRFTFDFGSTRLIGRHVFLNLTNSFDGVHINVAKGNQWRVRAFFTEPKQIHSTSLDTQTSKEVFGARWGNSSNCRG